MNGVILDNLTVRTPSFLSVPKVSTPILKMLLAIQWSLFFKILHKYFKTFHSVITKLQSSSHRPTLTQLTKIRRLFGVPTVLSIIWPMFHSWCLELGKGRKYRCAASLLTHFWYYPLYLNYQTLSTYPKATYSLVASLLLTRCVFKWTITITTE